VNEVKTGEKVAGQASEAFTQIVNNSMNLAVVLHEISEAVAQQSQGIDQISQGLAQVENATQDFAASTEETSSSVNEISGEMDSLAQLISRFQLKNQSPQMQRSPNSSNTGKRSATPKAIPDAPKVSKPKSAEFEPKDQIDLGDDFGKY